MERAFARLAYRTRLKFVRLLVRAGEQGLNVGDIQHLLEVPASTLALHLAALMTAGRVITGGHLV